MGIDLSFFFSVFSAGSCCVIMASGSGKTTSWRSSVFFSGTIVFGGATFFSWGFGCDGLADAGEIAWSVFGASKLVPARNILCVFGSGGTGSGGAGSGSVGFGGGSNAFGCSGIFGAGSSVAVTFCCFLMACNCFKTFAGICLVSMIG